MDKKIKTNIVMFMLIITSILFVGCSDAIQNNQKNENTETKISFDPSKSKNIKELKFSIPNMDKKMCETYPELITNNLEEEPGILDVTFKYEGHIFIVTYDSDIISKEELLNYDTYNWIGTEFLEEKNISLNEINPQEIYNKRFENNIFEMPKDHMTGFEDGYPEGYAQNKMGMGSN